MRAKKFITIFIICVMVLQLLPVKQAIRYFFIDNVMVEEILHVNKNATKNFRLLDEDHLMSDFDFTLHYYVALHNQELHSYAEMLPAIDPADIQTPPPDFIS